MLAKDDKSYSLPRSSDPSNAGIGRQRPWHRIPIVAGYVLVIFCAIGSLFLPEIADQRLFAWVGRVILDGGAPYRDAWEIKGPLTEYTYAFALLLFGRREISVRILDLVAFSASCWCLRGLLRRLTGGNKFGANSAIIFFALVYYGGGGGVDATALPDGWASMVVLVVVALLLAKNQNSRVPMALAGALSAVAVLIKATYLLYIVLPLLCLVESQSGTRSRIVNLVVCVVAFSLAIGVGLIPLYRAHALGDFVDVLRWLYTTYSSPTGGRQSITVELTNLPNSFFKLGLLIPFAIALGGISTVYHSYGSRLGRILMAWFVLGLLMAILQGRYWQEHFLSAVIAAAAIIGATSASLQVRFCDSAAPSAIRCALSVLIWLGAVAVPAVYALNNSYDWPLYALGYETRDQYVKRVTSSLTYENYSAKKWLARYVTAHSSANDRVFVWGDGASLSVMSGRKLATRFAIISPLCSQGPMKTSYREEFMREISGDPPKYIVVEPGRYDMGCLSDFSEFRGFLTHRYRLSENFESTQLLLLRGLE